MLFSLSPNDLVYVPTPDEIDDGRIASFDNSRIYKFVSATGTDCFFVSHSVSGMIWDKKEFSPLNKMEKAITGEMIKKVCVPIKVDRLGHIIEINGKKIKPPT